MRGTGSSGAMLLTAGPLSSTTPCPPARAALRMHRAGGVHMAMDVATPTSRRVRACRSFALIALMAAVVQVSFSAPAGAELIFDQYGNAFSTDQTCPWKIPENPGCPICPLPYVPCWQEGFFCLRPIYCQGIHAPPPNPVLERRRTCGHERDLLIQQRERTRTMAHALRAQS